MVSTVLRGMALAPLVSCLLTWGGAPGPNAQAQERAPGVVPSQPATQVTAVAPSTAAPASERAVSGRFRVALPLAHLTFGMGGLPIASFSAGVAWHSRVALEAGVGTNSFFPDGDRPEYFARMGWTPTIRDWRAADGRGWKAELNFLAGWRRLDRFYSPDGHDGEEISDNITGHIGMEWSDWSRGGRNALLLRVLCGAVVPVRRETSGYFDGDSGFRQTFQPIGTMADVNFDLGVAF